MEFFCFEMRHETGRNATIVAFREFSASGYVPVAEFLRFLKQNDA
jgi:hypothetical protein